MYINSTPFDNRLSWELGTRDMRTGTRVEPSGAERIGCGSGRLARGSWAAVRCFDTAHTTIRTRAGFGSGINSLTLRPRESDAAAPEAAASLHL